MPIPDHLRSRFRHLYQFLTRQGIASIGNVVYGLLCVHLLPVTDYAKFAIIFGFLGTLVVLMDTLTTGTIAPLVGDRLGDHQLIADYIDSSRHILTVVYLALAPIFALVLLFVLRQHQWSLFDNLQIIAAILFITWFARVGGSYTTVLLLLRDRAYFYRIQILGSLGSLTLLCAAWTVHMLNIYVCVLLNCAQILYQSVSIYWRARHLLRVKGHANSAMQRQIVHLALPSAPGSIFYALQGQIMLLLLVLLGHGTRGIANLGALSRLGQILVLLSMLNPVFVEPYFARLQKKQVLPRYLAAILIGVLGLGIFCISAFLFPEVYLLILGPHYKSLHLEVGLMILGSSVVFLGGNMHTMHVSRRFVYWWNNIANIALVLSIEAYCIWRFDMSVLRNLLLMNVATSAASLLIQILTGIYGFTFGPQKMHSGHNQPIPEPQ